MSGDLPPRWRLPFMAMGMVALAAGVAGGLARLGWPIAGVGPSTALSHGPLMICGFFGAVIGLERAVALGKIWAYLAPLCSGLGALSVLAGVPGIAGPLLLLLGGLGLLAVSLAVFSRQRALHTLTLVLGAASLATGTFAWLSGLPVARAVPLWMAFLVLTIAGERLELSRFLPPSPVATKVFAMLATALLAVAAAAVADQTTGPALFAAASLGLAAWLLRQDVARRTVRERDLTRFIAVCLLSGYAWLAIGALILLAGGTFEPGSPAYDAGLHAILLGFVFAMVFGHASIIFPAVLGVRLAYAAYFYVPLALLHLSVAVRVAGALLEAPATRSIGGLLNAAALALFLLVTITAAARGAGPALRRP
jgi:hypothetical protein